MILFIIFTQRTKNDSIHISSRIHWYSTHETSQVINRETVEDSMSLASCQMELNEPSDTYDSRYRR